MRVKNGNENDGAILHAYFFPILHLSLVPNLGDVVFVVVGMLLGPLFGAFFQRIPKTTYDITLDSQRNCKMEEIKEEDTKEMGTNLLSAFSSFRFPTRLATAPAPVTAAALHH